MKMHVGGYETNAPNERNNTGALMATAAVNRRRNEKK
jgi:hypothetical protein